MHIDKYKKEDGSYENSDGCFYEDAVSFLASHCLGFCGCGKPEEALDYIRSVLRHVHNLQRVHTKEWTREMWKTKGQDIFPCEGAAYFAYYVLDEKELTEHGGSVPGWLTILREKAHGFSRGMNRAFSCFVVDIFNSIVFVGLNVKSL